MRAPWRRQEAAPAPSDLNQDVVAKFEAEVEEVSRLRRATRDLILRVDFDLERRIAG